MVSNQLKEINMSLINIILLESCPVLGKVGTQKSVKGGYARNYLIPQGKALIANARNIALFDQQKEQWHQADQKRLAEAKKLGDKIKKIKFEIKIKTNDDDKIFGSIGIKDIQKVLLDQEIDIPKSCIRLLQGEVRKVGLHPFTVKLHPDLTVEYQLMVASDGVKKSKPESDQSAAKAQGEPEQTVADQVNEKIDAGK
jgi:large subunit ribosomal protein L9